jgi:hypothetical protein
MPSFIKHYRAGKKEKLLFQHPSDGTLPNFSEVLNSVSSLPVQTGRDGIPTLAMPAFIHNGHNENIVVTARSLNTGKPDRPKILYLPPYPFSTKLTKSLFIGRFFADWGQEGISPFDSDDSMAAPYRSAIGATYAYAGGMRMLHDRIKSAHENGHKVGVFSFSYGANVTSAYLTYINSLSEAERTEAMPDKVFVIEGGKIFASTIQSMYKRAPDPKTVEAVNDNPRILPVQKPLSSDVAQRIFAVVNPEDLTVLGQAETWRGSRIQEINGTHVRAPLQNLPMIRKLLREHFQSLLN